MPVIVDIDEFLGRAESLPIIDVRSPGEYEHAHIPGAFSLPLFDNEERAIVGTYYKQRGRVPAVQKGLEFVGPKLKQFTKFALNLNSPQVLVHCWRGGMRSSAMAWLLETVDIKCTLLKGGYKAYRNHLLDSFAQPMKILLVGGCTGSGKTELLEHLKEEGEQVIDLEGLTNHKGSAFGALGQQNQKGNEFFENMLYSQLRKLDRSKVIWMEDESRNIGRISLPQPLWEQMRHSPVVITDTTYDVRLERLLRDYAVFSPELLAESIKKIEKRLGFDKCKEALEACNSGNIKKAAQIALAYYDKAYTNQLETRFGESLKGVPSIKIESLDTSIYTKEIIEISKNIYP